MPRAVHSCSTGTDDRSTRLNSVLHTGDLDALQACSRCSGDVAQPDCADQSIISGGDHHGKQFVEVFVWAVAVDESAN